MLPHHLRIPAHNRPAEGLRRTKLRVVGQGLPHNRHHLPAGFSARKPGGARHLFCRHQQGNQQRRSKCSPRVIGQLPVLRNGERFSAQGRERSCARLARLPGRLPTRQARPRSDGIDPAQKSSTDVPTPRPHRDAAAPAVRRSRGRRWSAARSCLSTRPASRAAGQPAQFRGQARRTRPDRHQRACQARSTGHAPAGQAPVLSPGCGAISRDDCADAISRPPEFQRQRAAQPSRPHNRDTRFDGHRRSIASEACSWRPGVPARLDGRDARPPFCAGASSSAVTKTSV